MQRAVEMVCNTGFIPIFPCDSWIGSRVCCAEMGITSVPALQRLVATRPCAVATRLLRAPRIPGANDAETGNEAAPPASAAIAEAAARAGLEAMHGALGATRDALVCAGALCLWHLRRRDSLTDAANAVREVLDNGDALARIQR